MVISLDKKGDKRLPEIHIDRHTIIVKAVAINYIKTKKAAQAAALFVKAIKSILPSLDILEASAKEYNESEAEDIVKDNAYITALKTKLDIPFLIKTLQPIADSIPAGELIIKLLKSLESANSDAE